MSTLVSALVLQRFYIKKYNARTYVNCANTPCYMFRIQSINIETCAHKLPKIIWCVISYRFPVYPTDIKNRSTTASLSSKLFKIKTYR